MTFKTINIKGWKQFSKVEIDFHPKLTILTGANSSGKTTILNLLARHWDWQVAELSVPKKDKSTGLVNFFINLFKVGTEGQESMNDQQVIGRIEYSDENVATLAVPGELGSAKYSVNFHNIRMLDGIYITSHRPVFTYRSLEQVSAQKSDTVAVSNRLKDSQRQKYIEGGGGESTNYLIKDTLLSWVMFGFGNEKMDADETLGKYFHAFEEVLRKILPRTLGFKSLHMRGREIVLETASGDFLLDGSSGGVSALIDLAWQIFLFTTYKHEGNHFVVLIDEIENHLHATMQRAILPDLVSVFPNVQFIVTTHSPLIVGSLADSNVYALRYNNENQIFSERLDLINKAKTASEVLRDILGVPFTMPVWVEQKLAAITEKYSQSGITKDSLASMRNELKEIGLEELMPEAVDSVFQKHDKA